MANYVPKNIRISVSPLAVTVTENTITMVTFNSGANDNIGGTYIIICGWGGTVTIQPIYVKNVTYSKSGKTITFTYSGTAIASVISFK